jgi:hypothetical protein
MSIEVLLSGIKSPDLRFVVHHWNEVRGARRMPGWSDICPARIVRQLPIIWAYIYDAETDSFTGRLAGDRIETIFGKSFRQTPLASIFPPDQYRDVFERAKRVVSEPAIFHGEGQVFRQVDRFGYGERVMLPLAGDGVHADGVLGCTEYHTVGGFLDPKLPKTGTWFAI